jgi:glycosyltransferase involved in cell wall biosynthesis
MNEISPALVSVIIPCYNQAAFLADAIESALAQTHSNMEVIVVDDGSTDRTASVAHKYPSARYVHQQNSGAAAARTAGLRESRGEFLIFLDSDDRLLPDAVRIGVDVLRAQPEWAFVTGHVRLIDKDGTPTGVPRQDHANGNQYVALLRFNYIWTPGAVLYRRSSLEALGPFNSSAGASADYELNLRMARHFPIGCHHQVVLDYRRHGENMSADIGRMLRSAVSVRMAQRKYVARDPAERKAWKDGIDSVKADFGGRLFEQVSADWRIPGRRRRAVLGLLTLLQHYPEGLAKRLAARVTSLWSA